MKKEKIIKAHTRKTKSGKTVNVRQHKASYEAAEDIVKDALRKKKGAGEELEAKKKGKYEVLGVDLSELTDEQFKEFTDGFFAWDEKGNELSAPSTRAGFKRFCEKWYSGWEEKQNFKDGWEEYRREYLSGVSKKSSKKSPAKSSSSYDSMGFTKDEFKEWYEGTGSAADKKVEKALRKALGRKAYNELSDNAADNYRKGGASKFFEKNVSSAKPVEAPAKGKTTSAGADLKVGSSVKMGNSFNLGKGPKESFKVISTFEPNRNDRSTGLTQMAWVERKNGEVTLAYRDESGKWMYDDTWSDTGVTPTYRKHLKDAGYSLGKAKGERGEYYTVKKGKKKDGLPDISYNPKYDNDEPSKRKPRKASRTKDVKDVLDEGEKKGKRAIDKYRKARDSKKTPKGTPFTFRGKTYYVSGNSVVTAAGNVPTDTTVGNVLYAFKKQKSKNPRAGAYKDAHGGISMD